jgi:TetR/AcrR family transcriptional regulator, fatty acid metabolism regulator protein
MKKSKVSTEIRRDQIARATLGIIADKGISALTTAGIAREAGMSEANLYRHFRNKEEILSHTVETIISGLRANVEKSKKVDDKEHPLEKLRRLFLLHLKYIEENEGIPRLVFSEEIHHGNPGLKDRIVTAIDAYAGSLAAIFSDGKKAGMISKEIDPGRSAFTFVGMIQISVLRWSLNGFSFPLTSEGLKLWNNFEKAIRIKKKVYS